MFNDNVLFFLKYALKLQYIKSLVKSLVIQRACLRFVRNPTLNKNIKKACLKHKSDLKGYMNNIYMWSRNLFFLITHSWSFWRGMEENVAFYH